MGAIFIVPTLLRGNVVSLDIERVARLRSHAGAWER